MRRYRQIIDITMLALLVASIVPASADAGSMLSGYGGPGEGNQAILGSALLGPGGSHGGGSGGSPTAGAGQRSSSGVSTAAPSGQTSGGEAHAANGEAGGGTGGGEAAGHAGTSSSSAAPARQSRHATRRAAAARPALTALAVSSGRTRPGPQPVLSDDEFLYILLALAALALTGGLTRLLVRRGDPIRNDPAKAAGRSTRVLE